MESTLRDVRLTDKYEVSVGTVFLNGVQALVRLPLLQQQRDQTRGLNTAGFITGYRGSPLGAYDAELLRQKKLLDKHNITFQPGVNEDLAATAIHGSQQLISVGGAKYDGVFSIWYAKGPGVDRSGDAFKHGNVAGVNPNGGVLVVYGDDHPGKSSTVAHQSEQALAANLIPSLYPSSVAEFFEFGLFGWALSRYAGTWVGFKTVNETVEQTATVELDLDAIDFVSPEPVMQPAEGVHYRGGPYNPARDEEILVNYRIPLVHQFVRANGIDRVTQDSRQRRLGIVTAGKSWMDVQRALELLGINSAKADALGIGIYKVGCIWPLEPEGIAGFARGQTELLVVEEKKSFLEQQIATVLFNLPDRPKLVGKVDELGEPLLSQTAVLDPRDIAEAICRRLSALGLDVSDMQAPVDASTPGAGSADTEKRTPFFCSGCPHSTSTRVPEGSHMLAGIGCHTIAAFVRPDSLLPTQMGGEGANWIGLSPFTETNHVFQNLGDGTYYHSGLLAIRAAVAAGINITYKILYNDAVAMTGGQSHDGPLSVFDVLSQVVAEGVRRCVVVSDQPATYRSDGRVPHGVEVFHRDELDTVQRSLRDTGGCTVLVYEQTCAAEKRRRRKKGRFPDPAKRMFINSAVCEGCGDCSEQSTCVSLQPVNTSLGRKRQIDQSSCNKDYSCVKGFCPSFVTVYDAQPKKPDALDLDETLFDKLPMPERVSLGSGSHGIMIAGVGGTGVITVGAVLGMAAHLDGLGSSVYDMTGLSQKNGAVYSHLQIAAEASALTAQRLGFGDADLMLAFDLVAAAGGDASHALAGGETRVVGNSRVAPTAALQFNPDACVDDGLLTQQLRERVGANNVALLDATALALALCGDTIACNLLMVGFAAQCGLLPVSIAAVERAVELNGVAVSFNLRAFRLGRLYAHDATAVERLAREDNDSSSEELTLSLQDIKSHRIEHLTAYQDVAYARRYESLIDRVSDADGAVPGSPGELSMAVAHSYAKLLAYKDEYEVARLYARPEFLRELRQQFSGEMRLGFNLAPPLFSRRDPLTGELQKREYGSWVLPVFRLLAQLKVVRGTPLDLFGYTAERREERQLIADYEKLVEELLANLRSENYSTAVALASLPQKIRGFGHVKERNTREARKEWAQLLEQFKGTPALPFVEIKVS